MALITVNLKLVSPQGTNDVPDPATGRVEFIPAAHGKYGNSLRTLEKVSSQIDSEGSMVPVELTPALWKVTISPTKGNPWPTMNFLLEEGMEEPVNLADILPEIVVDGVQLAKGDPGPGLVDWIDHGDGTVSFISEDGRTVGPGTMPAGPQGRPGKDGAPGDRGEDGIPGINSWDEIPDRPITSSLATPDTLPIRDASGGFSVSYLDLPAEYTPIDSQSVATKGYVDSREVETPDTGVRDMSKVWVDMPYQPTWMLVTLQRIGPLVTFSYMAKIPSATTSSVITLPVGFRPPSTGYLGVIPQYSIELAGLDTVASSIQGNNITLVASSSEYATAGSAMWLTTDPWPEDLPGDSATL